MHAAKQMRLSRKAFRCSRVSSRSRSKTGVDPAEAEVRLVLDRRDVVDGREGLVPLALVGHVGVEQRQVELHVHRLLEQLPGQVQPAFRGVDVLVEVEHEVVRDDRVAGGEERDEPADEVALGLGEPLQVPQVGVQVDLLDGPGVLDRVAVALVEVRVAHRPQGEVHPGVEQHPGRGVVGGGGQVGGRLAAHSQASQVSGFSSEQAMASLSVRVVGVAGRPVVTLTVACWMRVAGRERR